MNQTGFYRVVTIKRGEQVYFKYAVHNKIVNKEITRKDIFELKQAVEEAGLLWGIINKKQANKNKNKYNLKALQGRYGIQIG